MKDIAAQLARRAEPKYVKQRAKEAAVEKSMQLKDRIVGSPMALGIIGGLVTAGIARALLNQRGGGGYRPGNYEPGNYERRGVTFEGNERGLGERAQEMKAQVSERVSEKVEAVREQAGQLREQAMEQVEQLRERIPSAQDVKERAQQLGARARDYASEEPLITALGALAIGAAFGFLLPVSDPERRVLAPAREQIGTRLDSLSSDVTEKVQSKVDDLREKIAGDEGRDNTQSTIH